jgi:hypothetical protein
VAERVRPGGGGRRPDRLVRPRRRWGALVLLVALAMVTGCASIPVAGPVELGREISTEERVPRSAPVIASPPRDGSSPVEVLGGFLRASADFRERHDTAREFLVPQLRTSWDPEAGTTVYSTAGDSYGLEPLEPFEPFEPLEVAGPPDALEDAAVRMTADVVATIDQDGQYTRAPLGEVLDTTFTFSRVDGQWRIANLPPALYLAQFDVSQAYRQLDLYFLDPTGDIVVPNTVFVPVLPGLQTALVRRLLSGPTPRMAPALRTAFPAGTDLAVSAVGVDADGVATVDLNQAVLQASSGVREQMAAQLVWTLTQPGTGVESVTITVDGAEAEPISTPEEQTRGTWASFNPAGVMSNAHAYLIRDGEVGTLTGSEFVPLPAALGAGAGTLRRPAVSLDDVLIAGLTPDGQQALGGVIGASVGLVSRFAGTDLAPPAWGPGNLLWVLDRAPEASALWVLPPTGEAVPVALPDLGTSRVVAVRPSRDGTRVALIVDDPGPVPEQAAPAPAVAGPPVGRVVGDRVLVGVVRRGEGLEGMAITNVHAVAPALGALTDVAWVEPTRLMVLGHGGTGAPAPFSVDADGYEVEALATTAGLTSIAAGPELRPILGGTTEGEVVQYAGGEWVPIGVGTEPAYPG